MITECKIDRRRKLRVKGRHYMNRCPGCWTRKKRVLVWTGNGWESQTLKGVSCCSGDWLDQNLARLFVCGLPVLP